MGFLSDTEAARLLQCTVTGLHSLGVHRCPYGYHRDVLLEFVARNGLPVCEDIYHIIGCSLETDRPAWLDVEWFESPTRALVACNSRTRAIITNIAFSREQYDALVEIGIKIFQVGDDVGAYHMLLPTWDEAIHMASTT